MIAISRLKPEPENKSKIFKAYLGIFLGALIVLPFLLYYIVSLL